MLGEDLKLDQVDVAAARSRWQKLLMKREGVSPTHEHVWCGWNINTTRSPGSSASPVSDVA